MTDGRLRVVVTGLIAQYPLGGVTWDYLQYPLGLARLGHDVYYVEDVGQWPYNPEEDGVSKGCEFNVRYLASVMERFGLGDRWAYRFPWRDQWFGLSEERVREVVASADLVLNVSGTLERPERYHPAGVLAYVDSDPGFTQVKLARGQRDFAAVVDEHDVAFSFGETLPVGLHGGRRWLPTRQPIVVDEWATEIDDRGAFTTVMNWTSYKAIEHDGVTYGQKDTEFLRFVDLPGAVSPAVIEIAMGSGKTSRPPTGLLRRRGWQIVDAATVCPDLDSYRDYLQRSQAEWSVAKGGYVAGRTGWFSCRSACYLAAGRPVVVQDTGFSEVLPTGEGILTFRDLEEAAAAVGDLAGRYRQHAAAASEIAREHFDSDVVLGSLLERAMAQTAPAR
jgi:hypothetical protein